MFIQLVITKKYFCPMFYIILKKCITVSRRMKTYKYFKGCLFHWARCWREQLHPVSLSARSIVLLFALLWKTWILLKRQVWPQEVCVSRPFTALIGQLFKHGSGSAEKTGKLGMRGFSEGLEILEIQSGKPAVLFILWRNNDVYESRMQRFWNDLNKMKDRKGSIIKTLF